MPTKQDTRSATAAAFLGALIIDGDAIDRVKDVVEVAHFPTAAGKAVYAAMRALHARGVHIDYVTVADELDRTGQIAVVGIANLTGLINASPSSLYVEHYARLLAQREEMTTNKPMYRAPKPGTPGMVE